MFCIFPSCPKCVTQWVTDWVTEWRTLGISRVVCTTKNSNYNRIIQRIVQFHSIWVILIILQDDRCLDIPLKLITIIRNSFLGGLCVWWSYSEVSGGFLLMSELNLNIEVIVMSYQPWLAVRPWQNQEGSLTVRDGWREICRFQENKTLHFLSIKWVDSQGDFTIQQRRR